MSPFVARCSLSSMAITDRGGGARSIVVVHAGRFERGVQFRNHRRHTSESIPLTIPARRPRRRDRRGGASRKTWSRRATPIRSRLSCNVFPRGRAHAAGRRARPRRGAARGFSESLRRGDSRARVRWRSTLVMPIRIAMSSGHGCGKSAMGGMLAAFILSTRPGQHRHRDGRDEHAAQTAHPGRRSGTGSKCALTTHWFHIQATGIYSVFRPVSWKLIPQTCKAENAQAFAGAARQDVDVVVLCSTRRPRSATIASGRRRTPAA